MRSRSPSSKITVCKARSIVRRVSSIMSSSQIATAKRKTNIQLHLRISSLKLLTFARKSSVRSTTSVAKTASLLAQPNCALIWTREVDKRNGHKEWTRGVVDHHGQHHAQRYAQHDLQHAQHHARHHAQLRAQHKFTTLRATETDTRNCEA